MSAANDFETNILKLVFQNIAFANIGDAAGLLPSAAPGVFYIALHTADPGEAGDQTTSEVVYTGYARVSVARSAAGFTVAGNEVSNAAAVTFPQCTGGASTATHFSVGSAASGAGILHFSGAMTSSLAISNNITPNFPIGALDITAD